MNWLKRIGWILLAPAFLALGFVIGCLIAYGVILVWEQNPIYCIFMILVLIGLIFLIIGDAWEKKNV